jgi:hypothetical protein
MRRFLRFGMAGLVLAGVIAAAAYAVPSTKNYTATVYVKDARTSLTTFTVTLRNDPKSNKTFGSANIVPAAALQATSAVTTRPGWTAGVDSSGIVALRSTSNPVGKGDSVSVDVTVASIPASCADASWNTFVKQSNDFSGSGNDFARLTTGSDLIPLGSFGIAHVGTVTDALFPTVLTNERFPFTTTALDTCSNTKMGYTGAQLTYSFLTGAKFFKAGTNTQFDPATAYGSQFSAGVASADVQPVVTETPNTLTVTDSNTHITATSNSFDVVDLACTENTAVCQWQNSNKAITATTPPPSVGNASIGIGFNDNLAGFFTCGGRTKAIGGSIFNLSPHFLPTGQTTYQVTFVFTKQASGTGPASGFVVCLVHSMPTGSTDWTVSPTPDCPSATPTSTDAPCVLDKRRIGGGQLQVILFLDQSDPWGGVG